MKQKDRFLALLDAQHIIIRASQQTRNYDALTTLEIARIYLCGQSTECAAEASHE